MSWVSVITAAPRWILLYPITFLIYYGYCLLRLLATPLVKLGQLTLQIALLPFEFIFKFEVRNYLSTYLHHTSSLPSAVQGKGD
jgi:hypothetical protein